MLEECGFIYYLILARLCDVDPKMYQKEGSFCSVPRSATSSLAVGDCVLLIYFGRPL